MRGDHDKRIKGPAHQRYLGASLQHSHQDKPEEKTKKRGIKHKTQTIIWQEQITQEAWLSDKGILFWYLLLLLK